MLFCSGDFSSLNQKTLESVLAEAGLVEVQLLNGQLPPAVDLFVSAGVVKSKTEARRMIADGAAWVNNQKLEPETVDITGESLLFGQYLVLRRGRKTIAGIKLLA